MTDDLQRFTRAAEARAARAQAMAQAQIDVLAAAAFDRMWRWLEEHPGAAPREAILAAQVEFAGAYAQALAAAFSELLQRSVGVAQMRAMPIGDITLSQRLYRHAQQVAGETTAIVREHAKGVQQARDLALRLYDGYSPADGIRRPLEGAARARLPKALRALTDDTMARTELAALVERGQRQAARLQSQALRAAYSEAFDAWTAGAGREALKRKLWVAQREKNRSFAERIARTELHRAHQDEVAAEFMADPETTVLQVRMSPRHPLPDICDYHARADLWGLGPGCYPKAHAPKPPYHPHCWCRLRSRPDLNADAARVQPGAAQAFLRGMPPDEAARVLGSKQRLARALAGVDPVAIADEGVAAQYRTRRAGRENAGMAMTAADRMIQGLANRAQQSDRFSDLWVDAPSYERHLARRVRVLHVADEAEYVRRTKQTIATADRVVVVTPRDPMMRVTGKLAMIGGGWIVLLSELGHIVTSYPFDAHKVQFEQRHRNIGDRVDEHHISQAHRRLLARVFRAS